MSVSYKTLKTEREWRANTGLRKSQFAQLLKYYQQSYESIYAEGLAERRASSTQESQFSTYEDQLFYTLFSLKTGLTYDVLGFIFGCSQNAAQVNQAFFLKILEMALIQMDLMPKREFTNVQDFAAYFESQKVLIVDGTEQSVQRPKDETLQKQHYSGKKKTYR
jgi:Helix-turn-helix of DDE superfamily endonuclease